MEPKIIFEDEELLVIDKPAGMVVNRAETTKGERTVQDWVEERGAFARQRKFSSSAVEINRFLKEVQNANSENFVASQRQQDFFNRSGTVHRLDKETSGLLIVAKTPEAFENLQKQFKERRVKKTYLALVHGEVKPEEGEIQVPVGRLPWNRKRFGVLPGGREAITKYKVIYNYPLYAIRHTLLELYPQTGRTHQIRVHLKYFGHPIFGDSFYAGRKQARADRKILPRLFLHASKISFSHPESGEIMTFESPLPEELTAFLKKLKS